MTTERDGPEMGGWAAFLFSAFIANDLHLAVAQGGDDGLFDETRAQAESVYADAMGALQSCIALLRDVDLATDSLIAILEDARATASGVSPRDVIDLQGDLEERMLRLNRSRGAAMRERDAAVAELRRLRP